MRSKSFSFHVFISLTLYTHFFFSCSPYITTKLYHCLSAYCIALANFWNSNPQTIFLHCFLSVLAKFKTSFSNHDSKIGKYIFLTSVF